MDNCNDNNTFNVIRDLEISPRYVSWTKLARADYTKWAPELSPQLSNFHRSIPQCLLYLPLWIDCFISIQLRCSVKSFGVSSSIPYGTILDAVKYGVRASIPRGDANLLLDDQCPEERSPFVTETREEKKKLSSCHGQQILRGALSRGWCFSFMDRGRSLPSTTVVPRCMIRVTD